MMEDEGLLEAIVPSVPSVPPLLGFDDDGIEHDWDALDHVGLLDEFRRFDPIEGTL